MIKNKFLFSLAIILLLLSLCSITGGLLIQFNIIKINNGNKIETINEDSIEIEEEIDVTDSRVIELMSMIKSKDTLEKHIYKPEYLDSFYYKISGEVLVTEMNNNDLLKIMWFNLKDSDKKEIIDDGFVVPTEEFKKVYKNIFGDSIDFSKETTSTTADACLKVNYNTTNDNYEFYNSCTSTSTIEIYNVISKAIKNDKEINIYEKVGFYNDKILYSDIDLRNKITDKFNDSDISKYSNSLATFIYTFKIDNSGNYYFYKIRQE